MRVRRSGWALLLLTSLVACGPDGSSPSEEPPTSGELRYALYPGLCVDLCWYWELHVLSPSVVELRAHELGSGYVGLSRADLKPEAVEQLAALTSEAQDLVEAGTLTEGYDEDCRWVPEASATLFLAEHELSYGWSCAAPELAALDELLFAITGELMRCEVTLRVSPQIGCEILDPWLAGEGTTD